MLSRWIWAFFLGAALVHPEPCVAREPEPNRAATPAAVSGFTVRFDAGVRAAPATGRLILYMIGPGAELPDRASPADAPFFTDPQPMFGIDVRDVAPGAEMMVDDSARSFPVLLSELPAGEYRVQAVLDLHLLNSRWEREPGNLHSETMTVRLPARVDLALTQVVQAAPFTPVLGSDGKVVAEEFTFRSELLSAFHRREMTLRAGVIFPQSYDAARKYPVIYEIPGFGGDHTMARWGAQRRPSPLAAAAFRIVLDPESANGHTLFADSANNGPCAEALVKELIPALEAKYNLISEPSARLVTGHSSGAWSALWLQLNYPETFGGCWSSGPDPVDFRRFQSVDLYAHENFYRKPDAPSDTSSYVSAGECRMTIRQENLMEEVLGPVNTSAQQWDSWLAVFGPRGADGRPAAVYDPITGVIDRAIAEQFRKYDLSALLRAQPERYGPLLRERVRLIVGSEDQYALDEAVDLLRDTLNEVSPQVTMEIAPGYIKIVSGGTHETVLRSEERRAWSAEMLTALRGAGHVPEQ